MQTHKEKRVIKAVQFLEHNLCNAITVEHVVAAAHCSARQLYRDFEQLTAESIIEYLQKRRLSEAAKLLSQELNILSLALEFQFGSQEAFTRAFKRQFFRPPKRYRALEARYLPHIKLPISESNLEFFSKRISHKPIIETVTEVITGFTIPAQNFGMDWLQPTAKQLGKIGAANKRLNQQFGSLPAEFNTYTALRRVPNHRRRFNHEMEILVYRPGLELTERQDELVQFQVSHQEYAHFHIDSDLPALQLAVNYIFATWLPAHGYRLGRGPMLGKHKTSAPQSSLLSIPIIRARDSDPWWQ